MLGRRAPALPLLRVDLAPALAACTGLVCLEVEPQARFSYCPCFTSSLTCNYLISCPKRAILVKSDPAAALPGQKYTKLFWHALSLPLPVNQRQPSHRAAAASTHRARTQGRFAVTAETITGLAHLASLRRLDTAYMMAPQEAPASLDEFAALTGALPCSTAHQDTVPPGAWPVRLLVLG